MQVSDLATLQNFIMWMLARKLQQLHTYMAMIDGEKRKGRALQKGSQVFLEVKPT